MLFDDNKPGMWIIVNYEEEKFLAKVQHKSTGNTTQLVNVLCLKKPLGHLKASRSQVLMQKKSTGQKSDHIITHILTRMEKIHKSGYGNIEIHFIDISFVKSH